MQISKRTVDAFGYISLTVLVILFIAMLLNWIPRHLQFPLFLVALVLFLVRITLRLLAARQQRLKEQSRPSDRS